jgi:hypothetical protein
MLTYNEGNAVLYHEKACWTVGAISKQVILLMANEQA